MEAGVFESWQAAQWAGEDVAARLLDLPRRLSAALVQDVVQTSSTSRRR